MRIDVPESSYSQGNVTYTRPGYVIECQKDLTKINYGFYESVVIMVQTAKDGNWPVSNIHLITQAEAHAIEKSYLSKGMDPLEAPEFADYFKRIWEWTLTGLRVPEGLDPVKSEKRKGEDGYIRHVFETDVAEAALRLNAGETWKDIGDSCNRVLYDRWFSTGEGRVVTKWNDFDGLPEETADIPYPHEGHYAHWHLNTNPGKDGISGHYDVAVKRRGYWHYGVVGGCLNVTADYERLYAYSHDGFRQAVRGSVPEIKTQGHFLDVYANSFRKYPGSRNPEKVLDDACRDMKEK